MGKELENLIFTLEYENEINLNIDEMKTIRNEQFAFIETNPILQIEEKMKRYHIISLTYYRENNFEESLQSVRKVIQYAIDINDEYYLAKGCGWVILNNLNLHNVNELGKYYYKAEFLLVKLNKYEDIALLTARISVNIYKLGYKKVYLKESIEKTLSFMDKFHTALSAQIYMSIASMYSIGLNNFNIAIDIYSKALDIAREYELIEIEALILYYIGVGYFELNINEKAIETYNIILNDERFQENHVIRAFVSLDLISAHVDNNIDLHKVEDIILISEDAISKLDYLKQEQYSVPLNLFKTKYFISVDKVKTEELIELLEQAKEVYNKYGSGFTFSHVDFWLNQLFGIMYLKIGEYEKSIESHTRALEISQNYEIRYTIESYEDLARVYEEIGDYKSAFLYMEKANKTYREVEHTDLIKKYMVTQNNYEKLKENEKEKNDFFVTISHELKTPINIIYSSFQLLTLLQNKDDKEFKECYLKHEKSVRQNCLRMLKLINNLIDITKISSGSIKANFINYNIVELVEDITTSVLSCIEIQGVDIIFDTQIEEEIIKCDPKLIERIILNLLSNAIKFTSDNGKILVNVIKEHDYIEIKVKDNGIGIPDEKRKEIFNKFEQVDKSLNRKNEGSGVGLSIVKLLVQLHAGYIDVTSQEGIGSEFRIYIPNVKINEINENIIIDKYHVLEEVVCMELSDIYSINN